MFTKSQIVSLRFAYLSFTGSWACACGRTIGAGTPRLEIAGDSVGGGDGSLEHKIVKKLKATLLTSSESEQAQILACFPLL